MQGGLKREKVALNEEDWGIELNLNHERPTFSGRATENVFTSAYGENCRGSKHEQACWMRRTGGKMNTPERRVMRSVCGQITKHMNRKLCGGLPEIEWDSSKLCGVRLEEKPPRD